MTREGGCLCGAIRYAVTGPLRDVLVCHCHECRRWAGTAWAATACRREHLALPASAPLVWRASPASASAAQRGSCSACGACLFWEAPGRQTVSIGVGTLDDARGLELAGHIWVSQGQRWQDPGWHAAGAAVPVYATGWPEGAPALAWRPAS